VKPLTRAFAGTRIGSFYTGTKAHFCKTDEKMGRVFSLRHVIHVRAKGNEHAPDRAASPSLRLPAKCDDSRFQ
jgi:hypothetical protein